MKNLNLAHEYPYENPLRSTINEEPEEEEADDTLQYKQCSEIDYYRPSTLTY